MSPSAAPSSAPGPAAGAWRLGAAAIALVAYALLSNWLMIHAANQPYTIALLFGPLLLAVAGVGWQRRQWATLAACAALLLVLAVVVARGEVIDAQRLYVLQHAGIHAALAWTFGLTLRGGSQPLITALAKGLHGRLGQEFTPAIAEYTRGVTQLWVGYFLAMIAASLVLYAWAPWSWWSFFCTMLTPIAAVLLMAGEHFWRYHRHPEFPRVTLRAGFEAFQRSGRSGAKASR
jgi:uncharacterized membrane protein